MGDGLNHSEKFNGIGLQEGKDDIKAVLITSQDWWLADYVYYGPIVIRMAWHSAGTCRVFEARCNGLDTHHFTPIVLFDMQERCK